MFLILFFLIANELLILTNAFCWQTPEKGNLISCKSTTRMYSNDCPRGITECLCKPRCLEKKNILGFLLCINATRSKPSKTISRPHVQIGYRCPHGCIFNNYYGHCVYDKNGTGNPYHACEPFVRSICPHGLFTHNISLTGHDCGYSTMLCYNGNEITYPLRLEEKYSHIMCSASKEGNCNDEHIVETCCFNGS
jgi:hypothetical protein